MSEFAYDRSVQAESETGAASARVPLAVLELKQRLALRFGERLLAVRLFGSRARGEAHEESDVDVLRGLAGVLGEFLRRMNRLLNDPPFNFMLHTAPLHAPALDHFHWHLEVIPKLTRVAGFEWGSGFFINPVPPEDAATALREAAG